MPPPFESLSIIDRPAVLAGTPAATHLGDFAAGVIKVGLPRADSPPIRANGPHEEGNKRSITIDLRETQGQEFLVRLGKDAVARIENFHPGTLQGWNLAAERLLAENPRLTMRRLSALGQTRSWRQFAGCDRQPQAVSRATYLTRFPGSEPVRSVFATADSMAGIWGAVSIIPAAYWRDAHGGRGQVLDLALCEPMLRACEGSVAEFRLSGAARERSENPNPGRGSSSANLRTWDGVTMANNDGEWARLANGSRHPRLRRSSLRSPAPFQRTNDTYPLIGSGLATRAQRQAEETVVSSGGPCAALVTVRQIFDHPMIRGPGSITPVSWGGGGIAMTDVLRGAF